MTSRPNSFRSLREAIRRQLQAGSAPSCDPLDRQIADRVQRVGRALRTRPIAPGTLQTSEFLGRIYERAERDSAAAIGASTLRLAFTPMRAPRDVTWIEPSEASDVAELMSVVPETGAPRRAAWGTRPMPSSPRRGLLACAAAIIVSVGAFAVFRGTSQPPELVFRVSDEPLSQENCTVFLLDVAAR